MIGNLLKNLLGLGPKPNNAPPPVNADDLFAMSDAPEYDGNHESRTSSVTIAPRSADADLAKLEAPLAKSATPEAEIRISSLSGGQTQAAKPAPSKPAPSDQGWDSLALGD
jgi:hypothetical protein